MSSICRTAFLALCLYAASLILVQSQGHAQGSVTPAAPNSRIVGFSLDDGRHVALIDGKLTTETFDDFVAYLASNTASAAAIRMFAVAANMVDARVYRLFTHP